MPDSEAAQRARRRLERLLDRTVGGEITPAEHDDLREAILSRLSSVDRGVVEGNETQAGSDDCGENTILGGIGAHSTELAEGEVLAGRYEIEARIGSGGLGVVYRVRDASVGRSLAVKLLPPALSGDATAVRLLKAEVRNTSGLGHPNICSVLNLVTDDLRGLTFVLMELLEGASLRDVLAKWARLPEPTVQEIARQAFRALDCAHGKGVVHRDVKPENLYWAGYEERGRPEEQSPQVKVLDFGISTRVADSMTRLTGHTGSGTAPYVSPELLRGEEVGPAADVYALGATVYELVSGEAAFQGPTDSVVFHQHLNVTPRRPEGVEHGLWALVAACLAKEPDDRPQSWRQAEEILRAAVPPSPSRPSSVQVVPPSSPTRIVTPKVGDEWVEPVLGMRFRYAPAGEFVMGSPEAEAGRDDDELRHTVRLTTDMWVAETVVTQGQYRALTGDSPSCFTGNDDLPVERVSWWDAVRFANMLSDRAGYAPCYHFGGSDEIEVRIIDPHLPGFRLPTEAEWEYSCRAGTTTPYWTGLSLPVEQANYHVNRPFAEVLKEFKKGDRRRGTVPVRSYPANPWVLYEMHGNVWEWCWDWWAHYAPGAVTDPAGPATGDTRVMRGGGWEHEARWCRCACRHSWVDGACSYHLGFRLVRTVL